MMESNNLLLLPLLPLVLTLRHERRLKKEVLRLTTCNSNKIKEKVLSPTKKRGWNMSLWNGWVVKTNMCTNSLGLWQRILASAFFLTRMTWVISNIWRFASSLFFLLFTNPTKQRCLASPTPTWWLSCITTYEWDEKKNPMQEK
jgi:hypothetical protein